MIALLFFVAAVSQERPLAHYLTDPCLRRIAAERFGDCTEPRKTKATVRTVGIVADYQIYEVDHVIDESETIAARSLVAGKSKVRLHEFHRQEGRGGAFLPTEISRDANDRQYVTTGHQDVGTLMPMVKGYYYLNGNRLLPLDLRKVGEIVEKAVPKGYFIYHPTADINVDATVYSVSIELEGKGIGKKSGCCDGVIEVPIYIDLSRSGAVRAIPAGPARTLSPSLWTRRVNTGKGEYADAVGPHPLRYFYPHPCLRKDPRERSLTGDFSCSASDRENLLTVKSKRREVGQIGELHVYEIDYRGDDRSVHTVLVGRSLDALYEIWLRDNTYSTGDVLPTRIVMAGGTQPILLTNFSDGGMYHINHQSFFSIDEWGPRKVDFSAVIQAARNAAPQIEALWQPATDYGVAKLSLVVGTYRKADGARKLSCCVGVVEVPYTIEDGIAKPMAGKAKYRKGFW